MYLTIARHGFFVNPDLKIRAVNFFPNGIVEILQNYRDQIVETKNAEGHLGCGLFCCVGMVGTNVFSIPGTLINKREIMVTKQRTP